MKTYKEILDGTFAAMNTKNIEVRKPKPGIRHNSETLYVRHRFPVNGGITSQDHLIALLSSSNPIISMLRENNG